MPISPDIKSYHAALPAAEKKICTALAKLIDEHLGSVDAIECKIWHRHPVWFIDGNPIVGYSPMKSDDPKSPCIRLMFWSGQSFDEPALPPEPPDTKFKSAGIRYTSAADINPKDLKRWLTKSITIQWDYKNIVKRKGKLLRLK